MTHYHKYNLKRESSSFMTNIRTWKCKCGRTRTSAENPSGQEFTVLKTGEPKYVNWFEKWCKLKRKKSWSLSIDGKIRMILNSKNKPKIKLIEKVQEGKWYKIQMNKRDKLKSKK